MSERNAVGREVGSGAGTERRRSGTRRHVAKALVAAAVVAGACVFTAGSARADTLQISRDYSNYSMGTSLSGHTGGGEWGVSSITGSLGSSSIAPMGSNAAISGLTFTSFCLERNETLSPGTYNYKVDTGARLGGVGGATNGFDPISAATAYLFKLWYTGNLKNLNGWSYNYSQGSGRTASAGELQDAIWYLEDELTSSQIDHTTPAWAWAQGALNAVGSSTDIDSVRVLVLTDPDGTNHQDVLVLLVPLPPAVLLGLGLLGAVGLVGFVRHRRNKSAVLV